MSVPISNEPGALSKVTLALAEGGVQVDGVNLIPRGDRGMANFLVRDGEQCLKALQTAGFSGEVADVHVLTLSNDRGALADVTQRLARAGVNIEGVFGTTYGSAGNLAIVTDDNATARKVLDALSTDIV
ncbi:MAG: hypothetical protein R3185_08255 [Candidatus Thermoplasmatota archaeon]|nr:hypothetical protein [Candidatus Thermoplasmatota archaeon]